MNGMQTQIETLNGNPFFVRRWGDAHLPKILMLHGFPEYWAGWASVASQMTETHRVVMPDQRGYNLSSKPQAVDAYAVKLLVADMLDLVQQISPDRPVVLCGHDWGASVAYAFAIHHPERVSRLVVANGVHPMCFQKALLNDEAQAAASQYIHLLRAEHSEDHLAADGFRKLLGMLEKFSDAQWLDDDTRQAYRNAWNDSKTVSCMVNWYRASPLIVPRSGEPPQPFEITREMTEKFRINMPHLLLWGRRDTALLPQSHADLDRFCDRLTVQMTEDAGHWILHEKPQWVADQIRTFLS